jgi:hypothetical protein
VAGTTYSDFCSQTQEQTNDAIMGGESRSRVVTSYPQLSKGPVGQQIEGIYKERLRQFTNEGEPANYWQFMQDG